MTSDLEQHLQAFDGVAVSILSEARFACRDAPGYVDELMRLCLDPRPHIAEGATWILKAEADDGAQFEPEAIEHLVSALDALASWQAELHICQSAEALMFTPNQARVFFDWAASREDHRRPFLRAWSLHAMVTTALRFDGFRSASETALSSADRDEAASVRARARALRKRLLRQRQGAD